MTKRTFPTLLALAFSASFAQAEPLKSTLKDYVASFDFQQVSTDARDKLKRLLMRDDLSHADKVMAAHTILQDEGALNHVDMHGAALTQDAAQTEHAALDLHHTGS